MGLSPPTQPLLQTAAAASLALPPGQRAPRGGHSSAARHSLSGCPPPPMAGLQKPCSGRRLKTQQKLSKTGPRARRTAAMHCVLQDAMEEVRSLLPEVVHQQLIAGGEQGLTEQTLRRWTVARKVGAAVHTRQRTPAPAAAAHALGTMCCVHASTSWGHCCCSSANRTRCPPY
jgi:hypothetical protein